MFYKIKLYLLTKISKYLGSLSLNIFIKFGEENFTHRKASLLKMAMKVNSSSLDLNINLPNLVKIEKMLNDQSYSDLIEFSANFNTRLCVERKLRMPFLDPQTGVAQNHSNLFMKKTQRIPGLRDGQIYTYPSSKWRTTRKRQYLTNANSYPFNYHTRPFGRFRDSEFDHPPPVGEHFVPSEEPTFRPAIVEDSHSKDSHQESSKSWYYDEMDIHDMDNFDDEEDSDDDFMEPRGGRKKRSVGRTPGSAHRRSGKEREFDSRRGRTSGRGRGRKVNPPPSMVDNSSNSSDKFSEYSRRRALNPPQVTTTHNPNPMSFDEAIPEHKIPTTERGKTHFDDDRMTVMSTATTSSVVGLTAAIIGSPSKVSITERNEKPRANPSTYCDFCLGDESMINHLRCKTTLLIKLNQFLGDARENKKTGVPEVKNHK